MPRHFNTAGPCKPDLHYMLPPERRIPQLRETIDRQSYFVLHAPRQAGRTTALLSFGKTLTREGRFAAVMVSMEVGASFPDDLGAAEDAILGAWRLRAESWLPRELHPPPWPAANAGVKLNAALRAWCQACPRPLVLFLDEIDALRDSALLGVLRQLRDGHPFATRAITCGVLVHRSAAGARTLARSASALTCSANYRRTRVDVYSHEIGDHRDANIGSLVPLGPGDPWPPERLLGRRPRQRARRRGQ